jgi:hypothetical protein
MLCLFEILLGSQKEYFENSKLNLFCFVREKEYDLQKILS